MEIIDARDRGIVYRNFVQDRWFEWFAYLEFVGWASLATNCVNYQADLVSLFVLHAFHSALDCSWGRNMAVIHFARDCVICQPGRWDGAGHSVVVVLGALL